MERKVEKQRFFIAILKKWLPVILILIVLITVPPAAFAVLAAYFTAPILVSIRSVLKLPLTIATLFVMLLLFFLCGAFLFIAFHGLLDSIPAIEKQVKPFTGNTDFTGKIFTFLEQKVIEYGHAMIEYVFVISRTIFQSLFNLFIFLVAFFFSLRESGKNRFWFLVYFPIPIRKATKQMLEASGKLIGSFISVEARLFMITFILLSIGFMFIGFKAAIGNAFLITLVDSIPFLGIGIFMIPMAAFYLYTGQMFIGVALLLLYLLSMITRQLSESYLWASTFQLRPVHAFFITACSVYLFGLPGILLTPFLLFAAHKVKIHPYFSAQ